MVFEWDTHCEVMQAADLRDVPRTWCHQDIVADGFFSLGKIAFTFTAGMQLSTLYISLHEAQCAQVYIDNHNRKTEYVEKFMATSIGWK